MKRTNWPELLGPIGDLTFITAVQAFKEAAKAARTGRFGKPEPATGKFQTR